MGSRGADYTKLNYEENRIYTMAGRIDDAEILEGKGSNHSLPEVSHKSEVIYIQLNPDGTFRELPTYVNHKAWVEIWYHREKKTIRSLDSVLHAHNLKGKDFLDHPKARYLTEDEFQKYKKYSVGLDLERILK